MPAGNVKNAGMAEGCEQVEDGDKRKNKTEKRFAGAARAAAFALAVFTALLFLAGTAAVFFINTTTARDILLSRVNERIPGTLFVENQRLFPWTGNSSRAA